MNEQTLARSEAELAKVVSQNPFDEVRESWRLQIEKMQHADFNTLCRCSYVLPYDSNNTRFTEAVTRGRRLNDPSRLRTELLPLPFCGNPHADVWYVQINPRGSEVDYYEFFSVLPALKRTIQERLAASIGGNPDAYEFLFSGENELHALRARQQLLIDQLDLSREHHDFYPMSWAFRTLRNNFNRTQIGSFNWWRNALCINNPNAIFSDVFLNHEEKEWARVLGDHLFVMEYYPYASNNPTWRGLYNDSHPYYRFFINMLSYAQNYGKQIVFRSQKDFSLAGLCNIVKSPHFLLNPQRVSLTRRCLPRIVWP